MKKLERKKKTENRKQKKAIETLNPIFGFMVTPPACQWEIYNEISRIIL